MKTSTPLPLPVDVGPALPTHEPRPRDGSVAADAKAGWIFYDGDCRYCIATARRFRSIFARRGFQFVPLQTPWVRERLGLRAGAPLQEMKVLTPGGEILGGAKAVLFLSRQVWWGWPLHLLGYLPGASSLFDSGYRWVAAHRTCTNIECAHPRGSQWPGWIPLLALPAASFLSRSHVEPWEFMWLMAGSIFIGCKWLTLWRASQQGIRFSVGRALGYLFLWPGMDASSFGRAPGISKNPKTPFRRMRAALIKAISGAILFFGLARLAPGPLLAGWAGMLGLILIVHFGLFDLAAVGWGAAGVDARPIMDAPLKAKSLAEFWGRRWNGACNSLVLDLFFWRTARGIGPLGATLVAFLVSGLIHELVISVPAGAGYGLPTLYFLVQGMGIITQRRFRGSRLQRISSLPDRVFTMGITAGAAFILFHPPFVRRIFLPFMRAVGAL